MPIDISPLVNAVARLEEGYARYMQDITDQQIRDGLIQRFEFTYDLSDKMLKRFLEETSATPEAIDLLSFQARIRTGNEQELLLNDWSRWKLYRDMRNVTSHTYDEAKALEVVEGIPAFIEEARFLRDKLAERIAAA
ncbi:nucleotidyltransferase [Sphingopyxis sp. YF1]|uniref:nucleotidyltransferase substrate binding protein n=1 Tax=Sphingopyxis sp. YF1 TaxID=2482763 RepID=UPI001F61C639|nr:nucleotidyltransferase substrate binding protein [Sphingopyxis sp. YF1]UNU43518.1 nucleotidyltransferase [Sphingopyxis sp. YF1]